MEPEDNRLEREIQELREEVERLKQEVWRLSNRPANQGKGNGSTLSRVAQSLFIVIAVMFLVMILIGVIQFISA